MSLKLLDFDQDTPASGDYLYGAREGRSGREEFKISFDAINDPIEANAASIETNAEAIEDNETNIAANASSITAMVLTEDTTVNFDSSMSVADMQTLIDAEPKNQNGYSLTFQFADGTYSFDDTLTFSDFFGGDLIIIGNDSDGVPTGVARSVLLAGTTDAPLMAITNCQRVFHEYLECMNTNVTSGTIIVSFSDCNSVEVIRSTAYGASTPYGYGFNCYGGTSAVFNGVYLSVLERAISCTYGGKAILLGADSTLTGNTADLVATHAGEVYYSFSIDTYSLTASAANGGQIYDSTGHYAP